MIIIGLMLLSTVGSIALATEKEPIPAIAKQSLEKQFPGHSFARWQSMSEADLYIVSFLYNTESMIAYIDHNGDVQATVRRLDRDKLPFLVNSKLAKCYEGYEIAKIEELTTESETSYMLQLTSEKSMIVVRMFSNGNSYQLRKDKRKVNSLK